MNRQEKRKYENEKKDKRRLLMSAHVTPPHHLDTPKMKEEDPPIVIGRSVPDDYFHWRKNTPTNRRQLHALDNIYSPLLTRSEPPNPNQLSDLDWISAYDPSFTTWESVAPFMTLQEARSAAGLEPLDIERSGNIIVGIPHRGIPDMYSYLFEDTDYLQEIAAYFAIPVNWLRSSPFLPHQPTSEILDLPKLKMCVQFHLSLETICLALNSALSAKWWIYKYHNINCMDCKSYELDYNSYTCSWCNVFHSPLISKFKHKDTYCPFCADELKRIKAGDTPCPLDTTEGLLL
jgi:hypothetical protein